MGMIIKGLENGDMLVETKKGNVYRAMYLYGNMYELIDETRNEAVMTTTDLQDFFDMVLYREKAFN